jgi:hypothetical protein
LNVLLFGAEMNKTALALLLMIFLMQAIAQVAIVNANFYPFGVPALQVRSPKSNPYLSVEPTVNISFDYYVSKNLTQVEHFSYSLDESANSILTSSMSDYTYDTIEYSDYSVSKTLENLANGNHSVTFYVQFLNGTISDVWHLTIIVDTTYKHPVPLMISPLNQTTYNTKEVPVIFAVNSTYVGDSLYCLDSSDVQNSSWQCLIGNGTLSNLSEGPHTLKLIIWIETQTDIRYVEYRETVYFNVNTNRTTGATPEATSTPQSFPATLVFVTSVGIAVVCIGLFAYSKKFHRDKSP